ncbi:MAG: hypothetical protein M3R02_15165 [Chloroflexota bacterium]|nr:hypothetical protein [Chloroflexota bacterium]
MTADLVRLDMADVWAEVVARLDAEGYWHVAREVERQTATAAGREPVPVEMAGDDWRLIEGLMGWEKR